VVKAAPSIAFDVRGPSVVLVDGDNGLGAVVGTAAMRRSIEMAHSTGIGFAGVRRSNHFGAAVFYVEQAVREGMIGFATTNAPPNMAPFGGRQRFLGTNPLALGIPAGDEPPLVFDASTSVVARGKIIVAAQTGASIPEGWAVDPHGRPTTDAHTALAGAVLPFGGPKGSAISFIIDILCGVLTGAAFAARLNTLENLDAEQNLGHVLVAIRADLFLPAASFRSRMDEILRSLKACPTAEGVDRVLAPGEIEMRHEAENRRRGICVPPGVAAQLRRLGDELGVAFPAESSGRAPGRAVEMLEPKVR
jgi:LDH2 family malate/lactate/ureidoglycolate dehydrogenase